MENRDLWLVKIWLDNSYTAYREIARDPQSVKDLLLMGDFKDWFYNTTGCTDKINWSNVDNYDVAQLIEDLACGN